ncbi:DUF4397 domain-containing protein [Mucilaginibacter gotjawali]|uniref:DUF4397 domain-containing protein n=1 Tax=Mucilaginibacter gotjawali TaxID=1550579 RepID=A0A839SD91_9SPHI|nr:DUF4397 domain-containing protein [Mucilaginibacter gotjawali]MBB3054639.1 hypothetical protein [Mucilaginibacter gotjawali]
MKTFKLKPQFACLALLFTGLTAVLSSCHVDNVDNSAPPAHVMVVNTVQGSAAQDFYLNNKKIDSAAIAFGQYSSYVATAPGTDNAQFFNSGSQTVNNSFSLTFAPGGYYTVYYTGKNTTTTSYTTADNAAMPPANAASVQFINFNADLSSGIDFGIVGSSKIATNVTAGTASAFYTVAANSSMALYISGSQTVKLALPVILQSGMIYTIYITGSSYADISYHVVVHKIQ